MSYPVTPKPHQDPAQFLIQDPFGVRESILPLLSVNRKTGHLTGLGTAFCADPFQGLLTAQHIFEHVDLRGPAPEFDEYPVAMLGYGVVFGTVGLPEEVFAPVVGIHGFVDLSPNDPFHTFVSGQDRPKMLTDCLRLSLVVQAQDRAQRLSPMPVRCSGAPPVPGERLLAIGYPELGSIKDEPPTDRPTYRERMYGAMGTVVAVHPNGLGQSRPWPIIELEAHWRSGMSGGPLFNDRGEIVGLVSSSIEPDGSRPGVGFGLWFGGFPIQDLMPFLDASNPGHYRGFGVLRASPWHLAGVYPDEPSARAHASILGSDYEVRFGSNRYGTDDFISFAGG